jgi:hypothetical protein
MSTLTKAAILESLRRFARQRPGLEFGNYGDATAYRAELRSITHRHCWHLLPCATRSRPTCC